MDKVFTVQACDPGCYAFSGNIDAQAEKTLVEFSLQAAGTEVRIDFSRAGRINSMGIALLLRCFKRLREEYGARISVSGLSPMHATLFKMTGLFLLAENAR